MVCLQKLWSFRVFCEIGKRKDGTTSLNACLIPMTYATVSFLVTGVYPGFFIGGSKFLSEL